MRPLLVSLDRPLPTSLPVGRASALFCVGGCDRPVKSLEVRVDGTRQRAFTAGDRFWATVAVPAREEPGAIELGAVSGELEAPLGRIEVVEGTPPPTVPAAGIAICMATFEPNPELFQAQIESVRAQTDRDWVCLISDDCSSPEHFEQIERIVAGDGRFVVSRSEERLGFYRNFERALGLVPADAELVALCDQDDRWYPEKLEVLRAGLGDAGLVYSDQRLVDAGGRVLQETLWRGRRNNHSDLTSLLVANTITGAATLFRRGVIEVALPFPDVPGWQIHDHWLGLVALACGDVAYVDRALYDYVQHRGAIFGQVTGTRDARARPPLLERWRAAYFYGYVPREVQAQTLLGRCGERLTSEKKAALERYLAAARSPLALARLALRSLRSLSGRNETLGSELSLATGLLWLRLIRLRRRADTRLPNLDSFEQKRLRRWRAGLM